MLNRAAVSVTGTTLVAIGAVGLFLPVIPGLVLVASGLAVLGRQYSWARRTLNRLTPARFRHEPPSSAEAA